MIGVSPSPPPTAETIAIVDDEPANLTVLEATLSRAGYRVVLFPRGEWALAAAQEEPPDLGLFDVRMPGLDGYELCRRFKADERLRDIPIIFVSALSATEDIAAGFECGGVDYIAKPYREPEVLARVRTHLALRKAYLDLADQHARLQALEQHRDSLVHMLVHDLRGPLQVIRGYLELIEEGLIVGQADSADLDNLQRAIRNTQQLDLMVTTVVQLSRMESASIPLQRRPVPVHELYQAAQMLAFPPKARLEIGVRMAESLPLLLCDLEVSARILANLLGNALKHTPDQTLIEFGAEPHPAGVRLWVRDRGPGIPSQYHQLIFEKFGVAAQPRDQRPGSTGFGLAFCKLAVEAQGGTIGVESEPGQGSTFWFTLPAAG